MASYIVTGIHAAARAGKYGKVSEARALECRFPPPGYLSYLLASIFVASRVGLRWRLVAATMVGANICTVNVVERKLFVAF